MTAGDHLQGQQFFHGTNADLKPGDLIHPNHLPEDEGFSADYADLGHHDFVWTAKTPSEASTFGKHTYEVEPTGLTNEYKDYGGSGYHVSLAPMRVKRKVEPFSKPWDVVPD